MDTTPGTEGLVLPRTRPSVPYVATEAELAEVVAFYSSQDVFAVDTETMGEHRGDPLRNEVVWIGLAAQGRVDIIPVGHPNGELVEVRQALLPSGHARLAEGKPLRKGDVSKAQSRRRNVFSDPPQQLNRAVVMDALKPLFFDPDKIVIAHNAKFDFRSLAKYFGAIPTSTPWDTVVSEFVINDMNQNYLKLFQCVKRRLNFDMEKGVGECIERHSFQEVALYLWLDVYYTWLLFRDNYKRLGKLDLLDVMEREARLETVLMHMEDAGSLIDSDALEVLKKELEEGIIQATADAYRAAGHPFSVTSPQEIQQVLFTEQSLTPTVFTEKKQEPSTADAALQAHAKNPVVKALLEIRELKKLQSTYVVPYLGGEVERTTNGKTRIEVRESALVDGRIHTSFKQHGARTGRLSSASPNLQQIPNPEKSTYGKRIRDCFIAEPGHVLVNADYSQIEPRILAGLSRDPVMHSAFMNGEDVYTAIADPLGFGRSAGKLLMLSIMYGVGPDKISDTLKISKKKALALLDDFDKMHPKIVEFKKQVVDKARGRSPVPFTTTVSGRRRLLPELLSEDFKTRMAGERRAFNTLIQGTASEVMKEALVNIHYSLPDGARLLLTVHDEVLVSCPTGSGLLVEACVKQEMERVKVPGVDVPLTVESNIVDRWGDAKG